MITLFLASMTIIAIPVSAQPTEVWVDDDYTSATPTWGTTHFDEIQDGVDAVAVGGIVHVYEGIYDEQVVIGKSLTLVGAGDTTIIESSSAAKLTTVLGGRWGVGRNKLQASLWQMFLMEAAS